MKRRILIGFILCFFLYTTAHGSYVRSLKEIGAGIVGKAVTNTLYVSLNGTGNGGLTWNTAYTTIQGALAAASTDADECTLILISPNATAYDINTTGDPTYTGNYIIKGSHRNWAKITNNHGSATSVLKFTGKASLIDLTIDCGSGSLNGVIFDGAGANGARIRKTYIECEDVIGAQTAITLSGGIEYARFEDVMIHGVQAHTTGILLDNCKLSHFKNMEIHDCLKGIQITNAASDDNMFEAIMLHTCTIGLDIDAGNEQMFECIEFRGNTRDIDDEVSDHTYSDIRGAFDIYLYPDDFTGIVVSSGAGAGDYGAALVDMIPVNTIDNPYRIVGVHFKVDTSQQSRVSFTDDGVTFYDDLFFDGDKRTQGAAPSGTEHIFNANTQIEMRAKVVGAGPDDIYVWVEIQEM